MLKKFLILLTAIIIFSNQADAAKIDIYRDAILNKNFTIKYEITSPPIYQSNHDGSLSEWGFSQKSTGYNYNMHSGIVVENGENRYSETYSSIQINNAYRDTTGKNNVAQSKIMYNGSCQLVKDGELFNFFYEVKDGQKKYYGGQGVFGKSHSVKAAENKYLTPYQNFLNEYNLGSSILTKAFLPIIPPEKVIDTPQTPQYKFIGSGNLEGGLSFEDFASDRNNIFSAVRYYFEGDKLVKIAQASYLKNGNEIAAYEKSVVNITEFSTTAEQSYLSLPAELKDKTKRDKDGKK